MLVDAARRMHPQALRTLAVHWRHVIDADPSGHDTQAVTDRRYLSISTTLAGVVVLDGQLPPEDGALLLTALHALSAPLPADPRTPRQRRADALTELARQTLHRGDLPDSGGERPHLTVTLDLPTLRAQPGARAAEADLTGPISAETARRLACDAGVTRIITNGPSEILDVGRRTRTIPTALRKALTTRDRGCTHPTCDRPAPWCDAHHIIQWADGGPTNLTLLCAHHHRLAHQHHAHHRRIPPPRTPRQPATSSAEAIPR